MPYITCQEGNVHSKYEQSPHVKQVIYIKNKIDDNGNFPVYIELIPCNRKEYNIKTVNKNYEPLPYTLIFGLIVFQILVLYIIKKLTD